MIVHNFDPILVDLGFFQIRWYSIAYIVGIVIGWIYAAKIISLTENNHYNFTQVKKSDFDNLIIYAVFGIILGGRLGYVLFYNLDYYIQNLHEILMTWHGGMSFHGGLIGVIVAVYIFSKKEKNNFFKYADIISCVAPIGIFLGRIANYINGELYGKVTNISWGVIFPDGGNLPRHPSQIYEAILEGLVLFALINYMAFKKKHIFKQGNVSGYFLIFYSFLRIISENFREPDAHIGYFFNYFSLGFLLSLITLISGIFIILYNKKNEQNN